MYTHLSFCKSSSRFLKLLALAVEKFTLEKSEIRSSAGLGTMLETAMSILSANILPNSTFLVLFHIGSEFVFLAKDTGESYFSLVSL